MTRLLLDTHAWFWPLNRSRELPGTSRMYIEAAEVVAVNAISIYEIALKTRRGKWPGMDAKKLDHLIRVSEEVGVARQAMDVDQCRRAGFLDWSHRDPWDRLIAAAALESGATLISADPAFDAVPDLERLWE